MVLYIFQGVIPLESGHAFQESLGSGLSAVYPEVLHSLAGKRLCILLVDYDEILGIPDSVDLAAQELGAEAVDGANEVVHASAVNHCRYAPFHLLSGLVGESEAEDISGVYPYFVYEKRITMSEHTSLSRPCARHNSYASFSGLYGLLLLLVKVHKVRPLR